MAYLAARKNYIPNIIPLITYFSNICYIVAKPKLCFSEAVPINNCRNSTANYISKTATTAQ